MNTNPNTNPKTTPTRSPSSDAPQQLREMAETSAKQSKETLEKIGAATTEAAEMMTNCASTALEGRAGVRPASSPNSLKRTPNPPSNSSRAWPE